MNPTYTFDDLSGKTMDELSEDLRKLRFDLGTLQHYATSIGVQLGVTCTVHGRVIGERRFQYRMQIGGAQPFDNVWRTVGALEDRLSYVRATLASARSIQQQRSLQ